MRTQKNAASGKELPPRLKELQEKIQDSSYIENAVDRIALIMSRRIVDIREKIF